ncbi:MAG: hypothetical protein L0Y60_15315 [Beijerinckiaceae bacterium]|nr:hypothetical protein [Beijerinckiaceae bacterium]
MSASNEKARRANAGRNFHTLYKMTNSTIPDAIESARLRYFARRIHALGERALFELFLELVGANLADRLPVYAAIDPTILAAHGGVALPPAVRAIGRAFE